MFKVGQKVWVIPARKFDVIKSKLQNRYELTNWALFAISENQLHETADDMFERLRYTIHENDNVIEYKYSGHLMLSISKIDKNYRHIDGSYFDVEDHLTIHQKGIELGWW